MGWLRATKQKENPQATELSQLKEELRRVTQKLESREGELTEALEQQTATSEILRVIASSPTDIQPVLDAVVESAARLCNATDGLIARIDGKGLAIIKAARANCAEYGAFTRPGGFTAVVNTGTAPVALPPGRVALSSVPLAREGELPGDAAAWVVTD